jgi:antirestriction protein ArdC
MTKSINPRPRADIYERVTASIIADLERGTRPWVKPWTTQSAGAALRPLRHDGTPYRGINIVLLWSAASDHGYSSLTWMTYRQAHALGGQVRKGETGSLVVFANRIEREDRDPPTGEKTMRTIAVMRGYTVFNCDQIDGLPDCFRPTLPADTPQSHSLRIDRADRFVAATGAVIRTGGNRACYVPAADHIMMPDMVRFQGTATSTAAEAYYATLCHEVIHNAAIRIMPHLLDRARLAV